MFSLMLATLGQTVFGLVLRHAQRTNHDLSSVGAINYITCTVAFAIAALGVGSSRPSPLTLAIGLLGGLAYVTAYFLFVSAMGLRGLSISVAVSRLSVLIPILFSILLWAEHPNLYQSVGAALALASLGLLSIQPGNGGIWSRELLVPAGLFVVNGGCGLAVKTFQEMGPAAQSNLFFVLLFAVAALVSTTVWLRSRLPFSGRNLLWGLILGLCNALGNFFLLRALESLPGVIVFPITSSLGLLLTTVFASLAWKERLQRPALLGIGLAVAAVTLINLK